MNKTVRLAFSAAASLASSADVAGEILLLFALLSALYFWLAIPITAAIAGLLILLTFSYRQIILAYPPSGGIYTVVRDNLGEAAAQVASAALLIEYTLTVAVGIAAGIDQIASLFPILFAYKVPLSLLFILLITYANVQGVKAPGGKALHTIAAAPTYCFITLVLLLIGVGFWQAFSGNLDVVDGIPRADREGLLYTDFVFVFLLLRTLNSGATTFCKVEPVRADRVAFQCPTAKAAATTLLRDAALLLLLYVGLSVLGHWIQAQPSDAEVLLAQVARTVYNDDLLGLLTLASAAIFLLMAANTSLADFPRLATLQAGDGVLAQRFTGQGSRPGFRWSLILFAMFAGLLIFCFQGRVSRLIPLYIISVFSCLTFAQVAMTKRWHSIGLLMQTGKLTPHTEITTSGSIFRYDPFWHVKLLLSGLGACITAIVTVICLVTKFTTGAWIIVILMPILLWVLMSVHRHYKEVTQILRTNADSMT